MIATYKTFYHLFCMFGNVVACVTLGEERGSKLQMSRNKVLRKIFRPRKDKLYISRYTAEEVRNLDRLHGIMTKEIPRRQRWAE